jgi:hypothetical protein
MAKDGSNYQGDLQIASPVINCTLKIKNQLDEVLSTESNKSIELERGAVVEFSGTYTYSVGKNEKAPTSCSGNWGTSLIAPNAISDTVTNSYVESNKTFSVTFKAPKGGLEVKNNKVVKATGEDSVTKSISVTFKDRIFYGTSVNSDIDITTLTTKLGGKSNELDFNCSGGKYFYYAVPESLGELSWNVGGLSFTGYELSTVEVTNAYGAVIKYNVYRSKTLQNGDKIHVKIS